MSELPVPRAGALAAPARPGALVRGERRLPAATLVPAIAAGSFAAGAAVTSLLARRRAPVRARGSGWLARVRRRDPRGGAQPLQIVASRSLLLDVHLLGRSR